MGKLKPGVYGIVGILVIGSLVAAIWLLTDFRGFRDSFRADTRAGRMQLHGDVPDQQQKDLILRTVPGSLGGQIVGFRVLTGRLPVGGEVAISANLARTGSFTEGGGWIFSGHRYYGTYPVAAIVVEAKSSRPDIIEARVDRLGRALLFARSPGQATVTLTARRKRQARWDPEPLPVTDSMEFTVLP